MAASMVRALEPHEKQGPLSRIEFQEYFIEEIMLAAMSSAHKYFDRFKSWRHASRPGIMPLKPGMASEDFAAD